MSHERLRPITTGVPGARTKLSPWTMPAVPMRTGTVSAIGGEC